MIHSQEGVEFDATGDGIEAWHRLPQETSLTYHRFVDFCLMGPARAVRPCYFISWHRENPNPPDGVGPLKEVSREYYNLQKEFDWKGRAAKYDTIVIAASIARQRERVNAFRDRQFEIAEKLLERSAEMIDFPLVKTTIVEEYDEDGNAIAVTQISPTKWTLRDAATLADAASSLMKKSIGDYGKEDVKKLPGATKSILNLLSGKKRARVAIEIDVEDDSPPAIEEPTIEGEFKHV
jgi:hypothetical protein